MLFSAVVLLLCPLIAKHKIKSAATNLLQRCTCSLQDANVQLGWTHMIPKPAFCALIASICNQ